MTSHPAGHLFRARSTFSSKLPFKALGQEVYWGRRGGVEDFHIFLGSNAQRKGQMKLEKGVKHAVTRFFSRSWIFRWIVYAQAEIFAAWLHFPVFDFNKKVVFFFCSENVKECNIFFSWSSYLFPWIFKFYSNLQESQRKFYHIKPKLSTLLAGKVKRIL